MGIVRLNRHFDDYNPLPKPEIKLFRMGSEFHFRVTVMAKEISRNECKFYYSISSGNHSQTRYLSKNPASN
jgi:hypothetical protein